MVQACAISLSSRWLNVAVLVAHRAMALAQLAANIDVEFLSQRESFDLGYPYLHVHLVIFSFCVRAIHCGRFTVHRCLTQIAASHLGVVLVIFLLLEYVLRRDCAPSPVIVHPDVDRTAGINRLGRRGLAAGRKAAVLVV